MASGKTRWDGKRLENGDTILTGALGPPIPVGDSRQVEVKSPEFNKVYVAFI